MKNKEIHIDLKNIKNSPYFTAALLVVIVGVVIAGIVYYMNGIFATKDQIIEVRKSYHENLQEIAVLEELRAKSQKAEQQLAAYEEMLPSEREDIFISQEKIIKSCESFGLTVNSSDIPTETAATALETGFPISVTGSYANIIDFMKYYSTMKTIHRVDALSISVAEEGNYSATMTIVSLSQNSVAATADVIAEPAAATE